MMNQRESFFAMINGQKPDCAPINAEVYKSVMRIGQATDSPVLVETVDCFGIKWIGEEGLMPEPNKIVFDDIAEWRDHVVFPDLEAMDLESLAAKDLEGFDPETQVLLASSKCGVFERLASFMGFEGALMAMAEDPEECIAFFEAMADFKIALHNKMIDLVHPDVIMYFDDVATVRGTFMSPEMFREQIKPAETRIVQAVKERGVIFDYHVCGFVEEIIDDIVEMGAQIWNSAQACNDIEKIQRKYGHKLLIEGGWDSQGPASRNDATVEEMCAEAVRCATTYAKHGNFILAPILLNENGNAFLSGDPRIKAMFDAYHANARVA